jgi:histidinol dehydrogenase
MSPLNIRRLDSTAPGFGAALQSLAHWADETDAAIETRVAEIILAVRTRGDAALLEYTARFDGVHAASVAELEIPQAELQAALQSLPAAQRAALEQAAERVRHYHQRQMEASSRGFAYREPDGSLLGQKVTPLDRVGIYVPGGKAAYPSSVLMNAIPAKVAGVGEIVMVVPTPARAVGSGGGGLDGPVDATAPNRGERNPLVLAAAAVAGVHRVFALGGAQAVAALAYGTATVPRVDKITGPGNAYVASAKRRVFGQVGIDMIAGPSEILVLADGSTPPEWVAMDLFSQAEHDELAQSILLCPDAAYLDAVQQAMDRLLPQMPRAAVIRASLEGRGALVLTRDMAEACAISNRIAPEHLEVSSAEPRRWEPLLRHAGAIFLGAYTSESLGDYCAGPNHVLPTSGTARFSSPLGVYDFVKRSSLIEVSREGAGPLGRIASVLAHGEGLQAHARAAEMRLESLAADEVDGGGAHAVGEAGATRAAQAGAAEAIGADPHADAEVRLEVRPVDKNNLSELMRLAVAPGQEGFVAPVAKSIAQAAFEPNGRQYGLYAEGQPVGYLLLYDSRYDAENPSEELSVWRLMIDAAHQRRGFGRAAVRWVVAEARRLGFAQVGLSHMPENPAGGAFYEPLGFAYTGALNDGERCMVLPLRDGESR